MLKSLIISPHLDDAVFSLGDLLASHSIFEVLNVFSNSGTSTSIRQKEEDKVSQYFNYKSYALNLPDFERREKFGFLPSRMHRFLTEKDFLCFKKIETEFLNFLKNHHFSKFYFPLGVGFHVDHLLCFHLFQSILNSNLQAEIYFYADIPYACLPGLTDLRLLQLQKESFEISTFETLNLESFSQALIRFLYSRPVWNKLAIFSLLLSPMLERFWKKKLDFIERKTQQPKKFLLENVSSNSNTDFQKKNEAAWLYQSQIKDFFHNTEDSLQCFERVGEQVWSFGTL